jgi:hypothetical protein
VFHVAGSFQKNYSAAQKVVNSTSWRKNQIDNLSALEKKIMLSSSKNQFLKSLTLTIKSGRHLSSKQIAVAERILSEIN